VVQGQLARILMKLQKMIKRMKIRMVAKREKQSKKKVPQVGNLLKTLKKSFYTLSKE